MNSLNRFTSSRSLLTLLQTLVMYLFTPNSSLRVRSSSYFSLSFQHFALTKGKKGNIRWFSQFLLLLLRAEGGTNFMGYPDIFITFRFEKQMLYVANNSSQNHSLCWQVNCMGCLNVISEWRMCKVTKGWSSGHQRREVVTIMGNCS